MRVGTFLVCSCVSILLGCSEVTKTSSGLFAPDQPVSARGSNAERSAGRRTSEGLDGALQPGSGRFINDTADTSGRARQSISVSFRDRGNVELSLRGASIDAAAKAILGDALGLDYTVSSNLSGQVTIQTTGPIPGAALFSLFEAALEANGAAMEQVDGGIRIVPATTGSVSYRLASQGVGNGGQILVAPLKYVSATEMSELMQPIIDDGLEVLPDADRNLIMMRGTSRLLHAGLDALNMFDVDVMLGKSVALVRLRSADPNSIVQELQTIFQGEEGGMLEGVVEFIPNARLGSVLIISSRKDYVDRAKDWIRELDGTAIDSTFHIRIYELRNRTATAVAPILNRLIAGDSADGVEPAPSNALASIDPSSPGTAERPRVIADDERNALVVRARRAQHAEIETLLSTLDNPARQVLLEATIAEVALNDEVNVGVRWFFEEGDFSVGFSDLISGAAASSFPGFSAIIGSGGAGVALNALASVTDVNVISSPTLTVVDNKEGVLQIGDEVPVATQTGTPLSEDSIVLTQVEYRNTGIILKVKPRIGTGGRVTLDVSQEVSDVSATRTSGIDSPTISQRMVQTSVVLHDGQTLVLGGLVQETDNRTNTQTPVLGDVPVVGALFRNRESTKQRTELLILIRPRVIYDDSAARSITAEWRKKLQASDSILRSGLGRARHSVRELVE